MSEDPTHFGTPKCPRRHDRYHAKWLVYALLPFLLLAGCGGEGETADANKLDVTIHRWSCTTRTPDCPTVTYFIGGSDPPTPSPN